MKLSKLKPLRTLITARSDQARDLITSWTLKREDSWEKFKKFWEDIRGMLVEG